MFHWGVLQITAAKTTDIGNIDGQKKIWVMVFESQGGCLSESEDVRSRTACFGIGM